MSSNSTAPPLDDPAAQAAAQAAAAAAIAALLDLAKQITLGRYFAGVALTLAVYDWIILFERESQCVWNTRWRWTKGIYYYNRIVSLIGLGITVLETTDQWTSELSVTTYFMLVGLIQWSGFFGGNVILTLRVIAMYNNRHPNFIRFLYGYLLVTWMITLAFTAHSLTLLAQQTFYSMDFHLCASNANPPLASYIFVVPAIFEMSLFGLTLYRAVEDARNKMFAFGSAGPGSGGSAPSSPLLVILYRDGFYYFATVFAVYLWIAIAYLTQEIKSTYMGVYFGWAISIVMSCRVYLNLAHAVHDRRTMHDGSTLQNGKSNYTNPTFHSNARPPRYTTTTVGSIPAKTKGQTDTYLSQNGHQLQDMEGKSQQHHQLESILERKQREQFSLGTYEEEDQSEERRRNLHPHPYSMSPTLSRHVTPVDTFVVVPPTSDARRFQNGNDIPLREV
ncbi:hypothetical protein FRC15_001925 [Serendipita sp. 397]|nr:hypothetical protein FRC15_001925 [Serendipita sp. 397]